MNQQTDTGAKLISLELCFLVDRAIAARLEGKPDVAEVFVRAAEGLIRSTLPDVSEHIGMVASRKGAGGLIAARLSRQVSPAAAASIYVVWSFRGARTPALRTLAEAFQNNADYQETVRLLCRRLFAAPLSAASNSTSIEVASPRCR